MNLNLKKFITKKTTSFNELVEMLNLLGIRIVNSEKVFKDQVELDQDGCYIINIGNETDLGGTHWTAAFVQNGIVAYFDSFGVPAPEVIEAQLGNKYHFNPYQIQAVGDGLCGQYVVLFLYWMSTNGRRKMHLLDKYRTFLLFWDLVEPRKNPELVQKYFGHLLGWL